MCQKIHPGGLGDFPTVWEKMLENDRGDFFYDSHCILVLYHISLYITFLCYVMLCYVTLYLLYLLYYILVYYILLFVSNAYILMFMSIFVLTMDGRSHGKVDVQ